MIAWKRGLSIKLCLATTNSKLVNTGKIKQLLKCLSGYVELAKLLQKPENKIRSNDLHKTNENAISSLPGLDIHDKIEMF